MLKLGRMNSLPLTRIIDHFAYLDAAEDGEVVLPLVELPEEAVIGESVNAFIYYDQEQGLTATTKQPKALVGEYSMLTVKQINRVGIFLDWGLGKDLFLPFSQQQQPMEEGQSYLVYLYLDNENRVVASAKLDRFLDDPDGQYNLGQPVNVIVAQRTELGFKVIIEGQHWGLIFHDQVFNRLNIGESLTAYVQTVREDGKINLRLQQSSYKQAQDITQQILEKLNAEEGYLAISDKSDPKLIKAVFGVSKGTYKKAIGGLFKQGLIKISASGIMLINKP